MVGFGFLLCLVAGFFALNINVLNKEKLRDWPAKTTGSRVVDGHMVIGQHWRILLVAGIALMVLGVFV